MAIVHNVLPQELEWELALEFAEGFLGERVDDGQLLDVRGRGKRVVARVENEIIDVCLTHFFAIEVGEESSVALFSVLSVTRVK